MKKYPSSSQNAKSAFKVSGTPAQSKTGNTSVFAKGSEAPKSSSCSKTPKDPFS